MNIKENYKNTEHKQREEKKRNHKQSKIGLIFGVDKEILRQKTHDTIIKICKYRRNIKI